MSNQSEMCHSAQPGGRIWCSVLEGAGRMFLLLAIVGGDREGTGGIQAGHVALGGGGGVTASPLPQCWGLLLRELLSLSLLPQATLQGSPLLPVLPILTPGGSYLGKPSVLACYSGGAAPSSRHGRNLAWGATSPGPTTACAGGSGTAGFIPGLLPPTPFGTPGHPCGHSWSGISSSFPPPPLLIHFFIFLLPP